MTKRPLYDPDERVFTLADIKKLALRHRKKAIRAAFIGGFALMAFFLVAAPLKYEACATFQDGENKSPELDLQKWMGSIGGFGGAAESQTVAVMRSYQVLKPLAERMGMQAEVPRKKGIFSKIYGRVRDNILAQSNRTLSDVDWFVFRDCRYEGETGIQYSIRFDDPDHFSLELGKQTVATGSLGVPVSLSEVRLTVVKTPKTLRLKTPYSLCIRPWVSAVQEARSQFKMSPSGMNKSVFELRSFNRDRYFGVEFLNALMEEYRCYLKRDYDQTAKSQLALLEEKQEEIYGNLSHVFDEYTEYLQSNLSETGYIGLDGEIEKNSQEFKVLSDKLFSLDLEWEYLCQEGVKEAVCSVMGSTPFSASLCAILNAISALKQQRDLIELSSFSKRGSFDELEYANRREELNGVRDQIRSMKLLLNGVEGKGEPLFDPGVSLGAWASRLTDSQEEEREDLAEYIENTLHLLSMQEKMAQEQLFHGNDIPPEFKGIDLEMSRTLFIEYNNKLDESRTAMAHYSRLSEEIEESRFEISSLSAVLPDLLSQRLIGKASDIAIKLKDEKHRSEKEKERWEGELTLQKKILKDHLDQLTQIERLKSSMFQDKISALQEISLDCITGQLSVLQEQLKDNIEDLKRVVSAEREGLKEKMRGIQGRYSHLPEKWRKEKWLHLKTQMGTKMIQVMTDLVESKTISSHLHQIQSKPLDIATLPSAPIHPGLLLKGFLGAFLAGFASFARVFFRTTLAGFPSSKEKLRAMRFPLAGEISSSLDGPEAGGAEGSDLEALREISLFLDRSPQGKATGLLIGKGPDYSHALAKHLSRMSFRPLLIRCDFHQKFTLKDQPGLLQVWKQEIAEPPIRRCQGYDFLPSGGYTPYGAEVIRSHRFQELLEECKKKYSHILLVFRSSLDSVESLSPLLFLDKAVVTVSGEPTEQLTPFIDWAYHEDMCRLAFLTTDSR